MPMLDELIETIRAFWNGEEGDRSHSDVRELLSKALGGDDGTVGGPWVRDVYDDWFVYSSGGKQYRRSYVIDDKNVVTMGDPIEVIQQTTYTAVGEAADAEIAGDFIPLLEKAVRRDGTVPVKIIQAGWGSSGYYPASVLKRDGPKVYTKGLKMYWNHPTASEETERPERDLRDLAAELVSDASWKEDGAAGAGLYADAKVFEGYKGSINELAPHIGVSHRALGRAKPGVADGREGPIIERIVAARSVDFVTTPGAGGQVVQLFESARQRPAANHHVEGNDMGELEELKARVAAQDTELATLKTENARLAEARLLREARDFVAETLAGTELPDLTRTRLTETLAAKPAIKDGAIDKEIYKAAILEAAKAEVTYLAEVLGAGRIRDLGGGNTAPGDDAEAQKRLSEAFTTLGLSESAVKIAAAGR